MNATITHDTLAARRTIAEQLSVIRTLLRLLDPASPFQPILVGSIDLVAWQAFFGRATETIEAELTRAITPLPPATRRRITATAKPLFSLAHSICDAPQVHMSDRAGELNDCGQLPELPGLDPDPDRSPEEENLVEEARNASGLFREQSAQQFALLRKQLAASTDRFIKTLIQKHGLLGLLRRSIKKSKRSGERLQELIDALESVLASPPPSPEMPWHAARRWYAGLATAFESQVLPEIDAVLQDAVPRTPQAGRDRKKSPPPSRQSIKNSCLRSWDSFSQSYTAASNIASAQHAYSLWRLFNGLTETLSSGLTEAGVLDGPSAQRPENGRIAEGIAHIDQRIIARPLLDRWNQTLVDVDDYALQIVLAAIHHLERPEEDDGGSAGRRRNTVYAFSEETMARWLSRGDYVGVNPDREASGKVETETRRTRRALEHLRRNQAAFHGRQHWSPLPDKATDGAARFWTVNPLLAAHIQIRTLLARTPVPPTVANHTRETRRRPSRRNRQPRRKT